MPNLTTLVTLASRLETEIKTLRKAMTHTHPAGTDAIRSTVAQLEEMYDAIMNRDVTSEVPLEQLLAKGAECLRQCMQRSYIDKPDTIPKNPDYPRIIPDDMPPTVEGIHVLYYLDSSSTMTSYYSGQLGDDLKRFNSYIKNVAASHGVNATFSLVWFDDITAPVPFQIGGNKLPIEDFPSRFANIPRLGGYRVQESGLFSIVRSIHDVRDMDKEQVMVFVTDAPSKANDEGITPEIAEWFLDVSQVNQRFGIIPTSKEPDINFLFSDIREIGVDKPQYDTVPWAYAALHV